MTRLLFLLGVGMLGVSMGACGTSSRSTDTSLRSVASAHGSHKARVIEADIRGTRDLDDTTNHNVREESSDDEEVNAYGRAANTVEARTARAFAKNYFAAAAAENGAAACSLLVPKLAKKLASEYGRPPDPLYLRGRTCAEVMTKLFKHRHRLMVAEAAGLQVPAVRVTARTAFIPLTFEGLSERRYMGVQREGRRWKLEALLDSEYP